ncbi:MAG: 1-(5-phosphoribosyl)-5-[(5-phosphoribosylamino)methylideneamino]imidazole-4-carboxamide isomerase [Thermoproteota archaeon]
MKKFLLIPSIDISEGRVVQIRQHKVVGLDDRFRDPVKAAIFWAENGAKRIHIIDIDGSKVGHPVNVDIVRKISKAIPLTIQVGGGVRNSDDAALLKSAGADLIIFRPRWLKNEDLSSFKDIEGMILGIDLEFEPSLSQISSRILSSLSETGARSFLLCDISVEGTAMGPRFDLLKSLLRSITAERKISGEIERIYAGGISSKDDLERLSSIGFSAAVVGTALYRGLIEIDEVI